MEKFINTALGFETTCKLIETINRTTDDYLFIWDIQADARWFFGDIDAHYDIRVNGSETNSTADMLRIIHPADRAAVQKSLQEIVTGKKSVHNVNFRWINRKGEKVWINCHGRVIQDENQTNRLMIGRVSEENLRHLYNPLTCLWNINKLRIDLKKKLRASEGYLMLLDIDGLAAINLSHGRKYGDALLKEAAEVCESMPMVGTAYHIDHNYFALVLDVETEAQAEDVYTQIKRVFREKCTFTAAVVPIDKTLFPDETQLMDSVDMTLKRAKSISHNRIEFFSSGELSARISSFALLKELTRSVENGCEGFELHYQPQTCAGSYALYGVEALLRYNSPTRGRVFPDVFIPVLEQSGLIKNVGLWVLREALKQCKQWRAFLPQLRVSVNFSVVQFEDMQLAYKVIEVIREVGLEGSALTIEITESVELHTDSTIMDTMKQLRAFGVHFAIDDFGTGYSNLGYLKQLDVDEIKIDRVFVSGIEKDTYNHKLVSNVIEFAKTNGIRTCCEGVESLRELATLELLQPDILQGYLFDKPNAAPDIQRAYMDPASPAYQDRLAFLRKIYEFKEGMGVVHFDPKDILRENGVGLWVMRMKEDRKHCRLHVDETMEKIMAMDVKYTPRECYDYWQANIHPDYVDYVFHSLDQMEQGEKAVQLEFLWKHPELGDTMVRMSGKRVNNEDGMVVLEGYYRAIADITRM